MKRKQSIEYHKLVRDRIPEIIEASGKQCVYDVLDERAYLEMLDQKLCEELAEYQESKSMEELADLLEVMIAVAAARGSSIEEVERIRAEKAKKRGAFRKRILLTQVLEKEDDAVLTADQETVFSAGANNEGVDGR